MNARFFSVFVLLLFGLASFPAHAHEAGEGSHTHAGDCESNGFPETNDSTPDTEGNEDTLVYDGDSLVTCIDDGEEQPSDCAGPSPSPTACPDETPPDAVRNVSFPYVGLQRFIVNWTITDEMEQNPDDHDVDQFRVYYNASGPVNKDLDDSVTVSTTDEDGEPLVDEDGDPLTNYVQEITGLELETVYHVLIVTEEVDDSGLDPVVIHQGPDVTAQTATVPPAIKLSTTADTFPEDGKHYRYSLTLNDAPKVNQDVAVDIFVIGDFAGIQPVVVIPDRVEFGNSDWDTPQEVLVVVHDDDIGFGDRTYLLRHVVDQDKVGTDKRFLKTEDADLALNIREDEVEPAISLTDETGQVLEEGSGDEVTFQVRLTRAPTDDVFIHVQSSNNTRLHLETNHFLRFGRGNFDAFQNVTVSAPDNPFVDGTKDYTVTLSVIEDESALEYVQRAEDRHATIRVEDDEVDEDEDGILDSEDRNPNNRFNKEFRPTRFAHELDAKGEFIKFTWTAKRDDRIDHYAIWQFSEHPTAVARVPVDGDRRHYETEVEFAVGIHDYEIQPVLNRNTGDYIEENTVPLGQKVFTQEYFQAICPTGAPDDDEDGVCDAFEEQAGTDEDLADTDGDGYSDHQEMFVDNTDPTDPDSHYHALPEWARSPWMIVGTVLFIAAIVVGAIALARQYKEHKSHYDRGAEGS